MKMSYLKFLCCLLLFLNAVTLILILAKKNTKHEDYQNKNYTLGILCYFKNERHIIHEWLMHHRAWGIEHIWLIDNGSEDDYCIDSYIKDGFVTLYSEESMTQIASYEKYLDEISKQVHWLAVIDMDEFLYSKICHDLKKVIQNKISASTSVIKIQCKLFCPSTFLSPRSTIESNIYSSGADHPLLCKCIFNLQLPVKISLHGYNSFTRVIPAENPYFQINHYRFGSIEFLYGIKEKRGGGMERKRYQNMYSLEQMLLQTIKIDSFLRDHSAEVITKCKHRRPKVELYPESSFHAFYKQYPKVFQIWMAHENDLTPEQLLGLVYLFNELKKNK